MIRPSQLDTNLLKTGDIILQNTCFSLTNPVTWFSWIIRKVTRSQRNHSSDILIIDEQIYVIESLWAGIVIRKRSQFNKDNKLIKQVRMKGFEQKFDQNKYKIKALMQLDKKYDFIGVVRLFLRICFGWRNNPAKAESEKKFWCSEFNAWCKDLPHWQTWLPKDFNTSDLFYDIQ